MRPTGASCTPLATGTSSLGTRPDACLLDLYAAPNAEEPIDRMMYVDAASRLPGQSLTILDRATMAYSLESRSPFLDPRFAEFMARVPTNLKIRGRRLRYLERRLGEKYLPPEVLRAEEAGVRLAADVYPGERSPDAGPAAAAQE